MASQCAGQQLVNFFIERDKDSSRPFGEIQARLHGINKLNNGSSFIINIEHDNVASLLFTYCYKPLPNKLSAGIFDRLKTSPHHTDNDIVLFF